jgi:hypothetical protein
VARRDQREFEDLIAQFGATVGARPIERKYLAIHMAMGIFGPILMGIAWARLAAWLSVDDPSLWAWLNDP